MVSVVQLCEEMSKLCAWQGRGEVMETVILEKTIIKSLGLAVALGGW